MKYSLLEMTQRILESMESDEVNSISDTTESISVANIIKECYFDIIGHIDPPETNGVFKLDASGDNTKPVLMQVPSNVANIDWIKYNKETTSDPRYDIVRPTSLEEFLSLTKTMDPTDTNVDTMNIAVNGETITFKFYNDRYPQFFTVLDEDKIIFNAYDSDVENTLTESRSLGSGQIIPTFTMSDSFVPDLDPRQFQLLLNEAKSQAFVELKQTTNVKAEQKARRNFIKATKDKASNVSDGYNKQPSISFGRK